MTEDKQSLYTFRNEKPNNPSRLDRYHFSFSDWKLYNLFVKYLEKSITEDPTKQKKTEAGITAFVEYECEKDDQTWTVSLLDCQGLNNVIGKFFLETELNLPQEYIQGIDGYDPKYKQPTDEINFSRYERGTTTLPLARQGILGIPQEIINELQAYQPPPGYEHYKTKNLGLSTSAKIGYGLLFFGVSAPSVTALTASCLDVEQNQKLFSLLPDGAFKDHVITALMAAGPHGHNYATGFSIAVLVLLALLALTVAYSEKWQTVKDTAKDYVCPGNSSTSSE